MGRGMRVAKGAQEAWLRPLVLMGGSVCHGCGAEWWMTAASYMHDSDA